MGLRIIEQLAQGIEEELPDFIVFDQEDGPAGKIGFMCKKSHSRWWFIRVIKYMLSPDICDFSLVREESKLYVVVHNQKYKKGLLPILNNLCLRNGLKLVVDGKNIGPF